MSMNNRNFLWLTVIFLTVNFIIINTAFAVPRAEAPVDPAMAITQSFAKWNGIDTRNYHVAIDYGVGKGTFVTAGVKGRISDIVGLDHRYTTDADDVAIQPNDNTCLNNQERIFLWNESIQIATGVCTGRTVNNNFFGITVIVSHLDDDGHETGSSSLYAHLSSVNEKLWQAFMCSRNFNWNANCSEYLLSLNVSHDTIIGKSGGSGGRSLDMYGGHLHYEIRDFFTRGTSTGYFAYTPDLPQGYGYQDPKTFLFEHPNAQLLPDGMAIAILQDDVAIRTGPGARYSVLGKTGSYAKTSRNQILVAERKVTYGSELSLHSGDTVAKRTWYQVRLPHRLGVIPVYGWIAAFETSESNRIIEERPDIPIFSVKGLDSDGSPIFLDYRKGRECQDRVADLFDNECVRIFDRTQKNKYLAAKVWNGMKFAVVSHPDRGFGPTKDDNGDEWHQIYLPELYFEDPGTVDCSGAEGVQCKGDIATGWLLADNLERQSVDTASGSVRTMDFEDGLDRAPIRSTIPGLTFTTTEGYDWIYADWRKGYNGPYPNGAYFSNGDFFVWLGENQGLGRIDFTGGTAARLSVGYSSASTVKLQACIKTENWRLDRSISTLCKDGLGYEVAAVSGPGNLNTGRLDRLALSASLMDYALFHDSGNFWLIDDLWVSDLLGATQSGIPSDFSIELADTFAMNSGQTILVDFIVDLQERFKKLLQLVLNWPGSEFRLEIYDPDQKLVVVRQSRSAPITVALDGMKAGSWHAKITAIDIPYEGYPVSFVVATKEVENIVDVLIDIMPNSDKSPVNLRAGGVIPVAIYSTEDFDVQDLDLGSLNLAGAYPRRAGRSSQIGSFVDLNNDGLLDLVVHFATREMSLDINWEEMSASVVLGGFMLDGARVEGIDEIKIVP